MQDTKQLKRQRSSEGKHRKTRNKFIQSFSKEHLNQWISGNSHDVYTARSVRQLNAIQLQFKPAYPQNGTRRLSPDCIKHRRIAQHITSHFKFFKPCYHTKNFLWSVFFKLRGKQSDSNFPVAQQCSCKYKHCIHFRSHIPRKPIRPFRQSWQRIRQCRLVPKENYAVTSARLEFIGNTLSLGN